MNGFFFLKCFFIWLVCFCYCCGYGVYLLFVFDLIINVIYECIFYYVYSLLEVEQKKMLVNFGRKWKYELKKVNWLLFWLVNYIQFDMIVDVGILLVLFLYLQVGYVKVDYVGVFDLLEFFLEKDMFVDFLYLYYYWNEEFVEQVFDFCVLRIIG